MGLRRSPKITQSEGADSRACVCPLHHPTRPFRGPNIILTVNGIQGILSWGRRITGKREKFIYTRCCAVQLLRMWAPRPGSNASSSSYICVRLSPTRSYFTSYLYNFFFLDINVYFIVWSLVWSEVKVAQSCPILFEPMDCIVHGILQARILEWVAFPFSRESSQPRDQIQVSWTAGGFFTS